MNRSTRMYNKNTNPFFSFTGKIFLKKKTCVVHYSYDVHGNVKTLIQDNAGVSIAGQRYKRMDYEYDLISGKVNTVHYQNNQPDQFHHKYEYDADNRITDVYTSKDKILWDHDAEYFYYPHGPLARVEYGDNHVQGIDYAYTLQGWIKGINSETLSETNDLGHDGNPLIGNPHAHFAKDAFGYSLTYFEVDYQSIGTSDFLADKTNSDLLKARNDLFNGNISAMVTTLVPPTLNGNTISYSPMPQGTSYKYDQLNRLIEMQAWQNLNAVNNIWNSGLAYNGMYHNKFTYDGNGNIETQQRHDASGNKMDDLVYNYLTVNGKKKNNRLYFVDDDVTLTNNFTEDIDDQNAGNYGYDELGNLTRDDAEEIEEIKWTVSGKVKEIIRTSTSNKPDLSFAYDATGNRISKTVKPKNSDGTLKHAAVWITDYYTRDAQGNIMSIYEQKPIPQMRSASFSQIEKPIYGSSRIGTEKTEVELISALPLDTTHYSRTLGLKHFEGINHLGNVNVVVSDKKIPVDVAPADGITDYYTADVVSAQDYYPFGSVMPGRSFNSNGYRYGFIGAENDNEITGNGNAQEHLFRSYDPRLGRYKSLDPLFRGYPWNSPYAYAENRVIDGVDIEGLEYATVIYKYYYGKKKPVLSVQRHNDLQHNAYGAMGKGVAFRSERYGQDGKLISTSKTSFYERNAGGILGFDHGFYYGPTQLPNVYVVKNYLLGSVDAVDEGGRVHDAAYDAVGATADNATSSWASIEADGGLLSTLNTVSNLGVGGVDPFNNQRITSDEWTAANRAITYFNLTQWNKIEAVSDWMVANYSNISKKGSGFWNDSETNQRYNYNQFRDKYMHQNNEGVWQRNSGMWKSVGKGKDSYWAPKTPEELK